jgi:endonuclease/exonuclease/phosphatase family metal-dependent hydrolase
MKILILVIFLIPFTAISEEIKVLTWNVFMIPKPINFTKQKLRTKLIAEKLEKTPHDIIFLQEAFRTRFQKEISLRLKSTHPFQTNLKKGKNLLHVLNSGLFIASKFPFKILGKKYYHSCVHTDCFASKGVILIEVTLPSGKIIQMATTHMQAWGDEEAIKTRRKQIYTINDLLDEKFANGIPQILLGDLNIDGMIQDEYEKSLHILKMDSTPLFGDIQSTNGFKIECYKTPGGDSKAEWLDHIWTRSNNSTLKIINKTAIPMIGKMSGGKNCPLSDHHAVEAIIHL